MSPRVFFLIADFDFAVRCRRGNGGYCTLLLIHGSLMAVCGIAVLGLPGLIELLCGLLGHFERRISFGYDADLGQVRAEFDGEFLRVIVPRRPVNANFWSF